MEYDPNMGDEGMDAGPFEDLEGVDIEAPTGLSGTESSFFLVPMNKAAVSAVEHSANQRFRHHMGDGLYALSITLSFELGTVSLGCGGTAVDIYIPDAKGAEISRKHCKFTAGQPTGAVVLYDLSRRHNTEVFDRDYDRSIPISRVSDSVVVSRGFNRSIALGEKKYYQFDLRWNTDGLNSWLAGGPRATLGPWGSSDPRYVKGVDIGAGAFGAVWRAVDIRTGNAIAVKRFHTVEGRRKDYADREVLNMLKLKENKGKNKEKVQNDHILEIIDFEQDAAKTWMEMLMPLMEGSLKHLAEDVNQDLDSLGQQVLYQMLLALKCTASHDMVHRDLKPDNILYETRYDENNISYHHFKLADFGLSHDAAQARTRVGTEPFMAPETARGTKYKQSVKMDLWSLFATMAWLWDQDDFRRQCWLLQDALEIQSLLLTFATTRRFRNIRKMARLDPAQRPSVKKLLEAEVYYPVMMDGEEGGEAEDPVVEELVDDLEALRVAEPPQRRGQDSDELRYEHYDVEGQGHAYNPAGPSTQTRQEEWPRYAGYDEHQEFEERPEEFGPLYDQRYAPGRMGHEYEPPSNQYPEQGQQAADTHRYASTKHRESKHKSKGKGKR